MNNIRWHVALSLAGAVSLWLTGVASAVEDPMPQPGEQVTQSLDVPLLPQEALGQDLLRTLHDALPPLRDEAKETLDYWLYLPEDYAAGASGDAWPLLVFLHGAGERGEDLEAVLKHGPPKKIENGEHLPCIVVSPQCAARKLWHPEQVAALIDAIESQYRVDPDRIYLTGLSMGGYGTWATAARYPERFAAAVPICGGGKPEDMAAPLAGLPIWVFHGKQDRVVPVARSEAMVQAIREAGGGDSIRLTVYPEAGHDSWTMAYDDPELWKWLFRQKRDH